MSAGALSGAVIAVTGAGGGLGSAVAQKVSALGASVACVDISLDAAESTAARTGGKAYECDVTDSDAVEALVDRINEELGPCSGLVNNAGIMAKTLLLEESVADWRRLLEVNLTGYFLCLQHFCRQFVGSGGGVVVNVASIGATVPTVGAGAYCVSKAGVLALTRQASLELGALGIRVNAVSPGYMKTEMTSDRYAVPGLEEQRAAAIPLGRIAPVGEVADAVVYLLSEGSSYVTGQEIVVDGGFTQTVTLRSSQPSVMK